jgi:hypothetical protein
MVMDFWLLKRPKAVERRRENAICLRSQPPDPPHLRDVGTPPDNEHGEQMQYPTVSKLSNLIIFPHSNRLLRPVGQLN